MMLRLWWKFTHHLSQKEKAKHYNRYQKSFLSLNFKGILRKFVSEIDNFLEITQTTLRKTPENWQHENQNILGTTTVTTVL